MYDEWEVSAHAKAMSSPLFKASQADAKSTACLRCHAPLIAQLGDDPIATEGVTCDVCHTMRDVKPTADGGSFRLATGDMVRYGPRCDLKDHYFHRMGCSPEHDQAVICSACHWWEDRGVPIFTEYADWKAGPAAEVPCQSCHMPKEKAALAVGSPKRDGVPHHGLLGVATDLRRRALELKVSVGDRDGQLLVGVDVRNVNAGHFVPSGLPERRLYVVAQAGEAVVGEEWGRVLVDDTGAEVPFWRATKVREDLRIASGATRHTDLRLATDGAGVATVRVFYRPMSAAVASQLGQVIADELLVTAKVSFDAKHAGKPVVVKAPAPGKRTP